MNRVPFSPYRVGLIAGNTLREAARERLPGFVGLLALALIVGVQWLRELNFGSSELKFLADFGFGTIALFGAVLAVVATAQFFFAEIEQRAVLTLLAKPVWRAEFLFGKLIGIVGLLAAFCAVMTLVVAAILWSRETLLMQRVPDAFRPGRAVDYAALGAAGLAQWLKLSLLAALTLLVATFARTQLFASVTGFLILVVCHLQVFAQVAAARGESLTSRVLARGVALVFPDFQIFDLSEAVWGGGAGLGSRLALLTVYSLGYGATVAALATVSFRQREI